MGASEPIDRAEMGDIGEGWNPCPGCSDFPTVRGLDTNDLLIQLPT